MEYIYILSFYIYYLLEQYAVLESSICKSNCRGKCRHKELPWQEITLVHGLLGEIFLNYTLVDNNQPYAKYI